MIAAIMQPTYLPWAGYFNLISSSDTFVFLDDAQFRKGSWHNRNRVIVGGISSWLTVPVKHNNLAQRINETLIDRTKPWKDKQIRTLRQSYARHPYAKDLFEICDVLDGCDFLCLSDLNIFLICWISNRLGLSATTLKSSDIGISGQRTGRLVEILNYLGVDTYLSPLGASDYLENDGFLSMTDVSLELQNYAPNCYQQLGTQDFLSHLSIADVVASIGWDATRLYIK